MHCHLTPNKPHKKSHSNDILLPWHFQPRETQGLRADSSTDSGATSIRSHHCPSGGRYHLCSSPKSTSQRKLLSTSSSSLLPSSHCNSISISPSSFSSWCSSDLRIRPSPDLLVRVGNTSLVNQFDSINQSINSQHIYQSTVSRWYLRECSFR